MDKKTGKIRIGCRENDLEWTFFVEDNGPGIARQHFERIFLIFNRVYSESEYPGSGIGLAVCKKIVERHGGKIGVESAPGNGAKFVFSLPSIQ